MARPRKEAGELCRRVNVSIDSKLYDQAIAHKLPLSAIFRKAISEEIGRFEAASLMEARQRLNDDTRRLAAMEAKHGARCRALEEFKAALPAILKKCEAWGVYRGIQLDRHIEAMIKDTSEAGYAIADMLAHLPKAELFKILADAQLAAGWVKGVQ